MYLIFSPEDKDNPRNWPTWWRWYICSFASWLNVLTCLCAGSISLAAGQLQKEFSVSAEVTTLCLSMYIFGFVVGPMFLAPLSEHFSRRPVYVLSWFCLVLFNMAIALAPNIGTIIVCRFLAGFAGSAPLTNTGGSISDSFKRYESGGIMAVYGLSSTFEPAAALPFSGYIVQNLGWRWVL
ncbi:major facilitator superfamily domain-containing protein [Xylariaceae sp. FL0016]|nr:major facilitator superfamily domain-containing protein [Xylariaceae sp. FL0016]